MMREPIEDKIQRLVDERYPIRLGPIHGSHSAEERDAYRAGLEAKIQLHEDRNKPY